LLVFSVFELDLTNQWEGKVQMKSLKMVAGTAALALIAFAAAPVTNAAALKSAPLSCNQQLVNCIDDATVTFDCCTYGADTTTVGIFSDYCSGEPVAYGVPALAGVPAAPAKGSSVPACLATFNATTLLCNGAYAACLVLHPNAPGAPANR
jgi:hypothetical protein